MAARFSNFFKNACCESGRVLITDNILRKSAVRKAGRFPRPGNPLPPSAKRIASMTEIGLLISFILRAKKAAVSFAFRVRFAE
jgi:hypothetical protein